MAQSYAGPPPELDGSRLITEKDCRQPSPPGPGNLVCKD
jgi:hypothetical protein